MIYQFRTKSGTIIEVEAPITEGPPVVLDPETGEEAQRIWTAAPDVWNTDGAHKHMYNKTGDKLDQLNKTWSRHFKTDPPPKSKEVPKNAKDLY